ncbi:unnamed protein product [Ectocarpus sp. 12 AP-2014]
MEGDTAVVDQGGGVARERRRVARAAAEYLLYQLCMAAPSEFAETVGPEMERRMLPMLAEQFVIRGAPIPSEAGSRGAGLRLVAAANALAGSGLIVGEKGAGRKRAAASAGGHAAVLADVARRMPLVFLEQVLALTELLLNDAEVERSAAAAEWSSCQAEEAGIGGGGGGTANNVGGGGANDGGGGGGAAAAAAPLFRSRRIAPGRLCPAPALLGSTIVDTDGRAVGGKGAAVLVHVRLWGQYFTEAVWAGVLGALRAAPALLVGGAAGQAAGVPKLLEAYVNLVAVQLMVDNGPEVAQLAVNLRELLEGIGEMGAVVLEAPPPAGGGPWTTSRAMLVSVPPPVAANA